MIPSPPSSPDLIARIVDVVFREFGVQDADDNARESLATAIRAALPASAPGWQPIETMPNKDMEAMFWVVAKTPDEAWIFEGRPVYGAVRPHRHIGKHGTWSALEKATHWMPLPRSPLAHPLSRSERR